MTGLILSLTVGAIVSCIIGMLFRDNTTQFLMRLVFIEAIQVLIWIFNGGTF